MSEKILLDPLEATRAALEPTLRAVADILPLMAQVRELRFPPALTERWQACCRRLSLAWNERHCGGLAAFRPAIFELCAIAVELNDSDCLLLSEALASISDLLEDPERNNEPRLLAAISATCEGLIMDNGLEHPLFTQRASHLANRLNAALTLTANDGNNPLLLHIFGDEAQERVDVMREALEFLPPDAYAIKSAAEEICHLAEPLELFDIIDRARLLILCLTPRCGDNFDLDAVETRNQVLDRINLLQNVIDEIAV